MCKLGIAIIASVPGAVTGEKFDKLAEGVMTSKALIKLSKKYNVEMPITKAVYNILFENKEFKDELSKLFLRSVKEEF